MSILSGPHQDVQVSSNGNGKNKLESVLYSNTVTPKCENDQVTRHYSVKAGSRRWPGDVFYNVIDVILVNSWVISKFACSSNVNRRQKWQQNWKGICRLCLKSIKQNFAASKTLTRTMCSTSKRRNHTTNTFQTVRNQCVVSAYKMCNSCAWILYLQRIIFVVLQKYRF